MEDIVTKIQVESLEEIVGFTIVVISTWIFAVDAVVVELVEATCSFGLTSKSSSLKSISVSSSSS